MEDEKYEVDNFGEMKLAEMIDGINNMTDTLWYVVQDLREEVKQLEFEISMKDDSIECLKLKIDSLKEENEGLREEINDLEHENELMEEELEELRNEM